jgi:hypothetical protein
MIPTIIILALAFYWLLIETDYLRVNLLAQPVDYRKLWLETFDEYYHNLEGLLTDKHEYNEDYIHYTPHGYTIVQSLKNKAKSNGTYQILLSPCVEDTLCGKDWLDKHWNDLADYKPEIYLAIGDIKYNMTVRNPEIIKDVMRVNRLSRKEVRELMPSIS